MTAKLSGEQPGNWAVHTDDIITSKGMLMWKSDLLDDPSHSRGQNIQVSKEE